MKKIIELKTIEKVKNFNILATKEKEDVLLKQDRFIVDGKSIMGIFSLNLTKPVKVIVADNIEKDFANFLTLAEVAEE